MRERTARITRAGRCWCGGVGAGHLAVHAVLDLAWLAREAADTRIAWAFRKPLGAASFGDDADDGVAHRGALGTSARSKKGRRIMAAAGAVKAG